MSLLLEDPTELMEIDRIYEDEEFRPMSIDSSALAFKISSKVSNHSISIRIGQAYCELKIKLPISKLVKRPDGIYVSATKWPIDRPLPRVNAWEILPDICLEVVSPTDMADDVQAKIGEYFREGVVQVWVAYPVQQQIHVYDSPVSLRILSRSDTLMGGNIIPGLELPLCELFLNNDPAA